MSKAKRQKPRKTNVKKNTTGKGGKSRKGKRAGKRTPQRQGRKASLRKVRHGQASRNARNRQGNRIQKARPRPAKRAERVSKATHKSTVSAKAKGRQRTSPGKAKAPRLKTQVTSRHSRTKEQIEFRFKGSKSIASKLGALERQATVSKAIKAQLKRKEGRPPRGAVVVVSDKDGNELAFPTPPDMVINEANLKAFIEDKTKEMARDHTKWLKFKKAQRKGYVDEDSDNPYGEFNPNGINAINVKFIYGK